MSSLPLVLVASNAFPPLMATKFPFLSEMIFATWICMPQLMMNWLNYLMSSWLLMTQGIPTAWILSQMTSLSFMLKWTWGRSGWMQWWLWGSVDEHELNLSTCLKAVHAAVWLVSLEPCVKCLSQSWKLGFGEKMPAWLAASRPPQRASGAARAYPPFERAVFVLIHINLNNWN